MRSCCLRCRCTTVACTRLVSRLQWPGLLTMTHKSFSIKTNLLHPARTHQSSQVYHSSLKQASHGILQYTLLQLYHSTCEKQGSYTTMISAAGLLQQCWNGTLKDPTPAYLPLQVNYHSSREYQVKGCLLHVYHSSFVEETQRLSNLHVSCCSFTTPGLETQVKDPTQHVGFANTASRTRSTDPNQRFITTAGWTKLKHANQHVLVAGLQSSLGAGCFSRGTEGPGISAALQQAQVYSLP